MTGESRPKLDVIPGGGHGRERPQPMSMHGGVAYERNEAGQWSQMLGKHEVAPADVAKVLEREYLDALLLKQVPDDELSKK